MEKPNRLAPRLSPVSKLSFAISCVLAAHLVQAAPKGGQVVGGLGDISQVGNTTTINQETDRLAIDWQNFDVGVDERVEFLQPGQSSVALNRILGNNGSQILGQIDANGHVILVNPRGIVFGKDSVINAGGLIASGLMINPDDFLNGDLVFESLEGTDGAVINSGTLNAALGGNITLLGKQVENKGLISANLGRVNLAAGKKAVLNFDADGLLGVEVSEAILQEELGDKAAVQNSGEIHAQEGQVLLSASAAREVFSQAVNDGGQEAASSVVYHEDGSFSLGGGADVVNTGNVSVSGNTAAGEVVVLGENISNSGAIKANAKATNEEGKAGRIELLSKTTTEIKENGLLQTNVSEKGTGGQIVVQGKNVGLFDNSNVQANGANGGGEILIGGDKEGLNDKIKNAEFVYIGENTNINANATLSGNGGKLISYAEDTARIYGQLAVRGGELSGNGGFVETSGKKGFEVFNTPDISAANGEGGHWLIDPYDISIKLFGSDVSDEEDDIYTSNTSGSGIKNSTIESALNNGATVTIQTGGATDDGVGEGNINVNAAINFTGTGNSTLNLIAHNSIFINQNITAGKSPDRSLNIHLQANRSGYTSSPAAGFVNGDDQIDTIDVAGTIFLADGVTIETGGADFKIGEITTLANGDDTHSAAIDTALSGALNVDLSGGTGKGNSALGTIDVSSADGGGKIEILAQNDVTLERIIFGDTDGNANNDKNNAAQMGAHVVAGHDILLRGGEGTQGFTAANNETAFGEIILIAGNDLTVDAEVRAGNANVLMVAGSADCLGVTCLANANEARNIYIQDDLTLNGEVRLWAADNIEINDGIGDLYAGDRKVPSVVDIRAGDSITASAQVGDGLDAYIRVRDSLNISAGDSGLSSDVGVIHNSQTHFISTPLADQPLGDITLYREVSAGFIGQNNQLLAVAPGLITFSGNNFDFGSPSNDSAQSLITNGGNIEFDLIGSLNSSHRIDTAGGDIWVINAGDVNFSSSPIDVSSVTGGGDITVNASGLVTVGDLQLWNDSINNFNNYTRTTDINVKADEIVFNNALDIHGIGANYSQSSTEDRPSLTLNAINNIILPSVVDSNGGNNSWDSLDIQLFSSDVTITAGVLNSSGGDIQIDGVTLTLADTLSTASTNTQLISRLNSEGKVHLITDESLELPTISATTLHLEARADSSDVLVTNAGSISLAEQLTLELGENNDATLVNISNPNQDSLALNLTSVRDANLTINENVVVNGGNVYGDLRIEATGDSNITQASNEAENALTVQGNSEFNANDNDLNLLNPFNDFMGAVFFTGNNQINNASLADANDLLIGHDNPNPISTTVNQNLTLLAGGDIEQAGSINVGDDLIVSAGSQESPGNITLNAESNSISDLLVERANNLTVDTSTNLNVQSANVSGTASFSAVDLTQTNTLILNALNINLSGDLNFGTAENQISTLSGNANSVTLNNTVDLSLENLSLVDTAGGSNINLQINQNSNALSIASSAVVQSAGGDILLNGVTQFTLGTQDDVNLGLDPSQLILLQGADVALNLVEQNDQGAALEIWGDIQGTDGSENLFQISATGFSDTITLGDNASFEFLTNPVIDALAGNDNFNLYQGAGFTFNGGDGSDTFNILSDISGDTVQTIIQGGTDESIDVLNAFDAENTWQLSADDSNILNTTLRFSQIEQLNGGALSDVITGANANNEWHLQEDGQHQLLSGPADNIFEYTLINIDRFIGGDQTDTFFGTDANSNWLIQSSTQGEVAPLEENGAELQTIAFENMNGFVAGSGNDLFKIAEGATIDSLDGGGGDNILEGQNVNTQWVMDTLGDNRVEAINVDGEGNETYSPYVSSYSNIKELRGGSANDRFVFLQQDETAQDFIFNGGEGRDTLDYSAITDAITVETGGNAGNVRNMEVINGSTEVGHTLRLLDPEQGIGAGERNEWDITGLNAGEVRLYRLNDEENAQLEQADIEFTGFTNLLGGAVPDSFNLLENGLVETIDGGEAVDDNNSVVDVINGYLAQVNNWQINADGTQQLNDDILISNMEQLQGGNSSNNFVIYLLNHGLNLLGSDSADSIDTLDYSNLGAVTVEADSNFSTQNIDRLLGTSEQQLLAINGDLPNYQSDNYNNTWTIDGENAGLLTLNRGEDAQTELAFEGFGFLAGQTVQDRFEFTMDSNITGGIDGGVRFDEGGANQSGRNQIQILSVDASAPDINWLIRETGVSVVKPNSAAEGEISNAKSFITDAQNIHFLLGGAGDDRFEFEINNSGVGAAGGAGTDIASFAGITDDLNVELGGADVGGVSQIESLVGNGEDFQSTLTVISSGDNIWTLQGDQQGQVQLGNDSQMGFEGFNRLVGGSGKDTFTIANNTVAFDYIDGGSGTSASGNAIVDVIVGFNAASYWSITQSQQDSPVLVKVQAIDEAGVAVTPAWVAQAENIERLEGQASNDTFSFNTTSVSIAAVGGAGTDIADYSQVAGDIGINLGGVDFNGVSGIERLRGNNDGVLEDGETPYNAQLSVLGNQNTGWQITDTNTGEVTLNSSDETLTFEGFNILQGSDGGVDNFVIEAALLGGQESAANGQVIGRVEGRGGNDIFTLITDLPGFMDGGEGQDRFEIGDADLSEKLAVGSVHGGGIYGGANADTFNFNQAVVINSNAAISGGSQADIFNLSQQVSGDIQGQAGNDRFNLEASQEDGSLLGGEGDDQYHVLAQDLVANIDGGEGSNTLTAFQDAANYWVVDEQGSAVSNTPDQTSAAGVRYTNIQALVGAANFDDTFRFYQVQDSLDQITAGDVGVDTLDYSLAEGQTLALRLAGLNGFESLVGTGGLSTLIGADTESEWNVNDINTGEVNWAGNTLTFSGFANLQGGNQSDTFNLRSNITGQVEGSGGSDVFNIGSNDTSGSIIQVGSILGGDNADQFNYLQEFVGLSDGGSGNDTFNIQSFVTGEILGNSGDDQFLILSPEIAAQVDGGDGSDSLRAFQDSANLWRIDSEGSGILSNVLDDPGEWPEQIAFSSMETLYGVDNFADTFALTFVLSPQQLMQFIPGSGAGDVLSYALVDGPTNIDLNNNPLTGFETLVAGAGGQVLGWNSDNEWRISESGVALTSQGRSLQLNAFTELQGGNQNDDFVLSSIVTSIDGGEGENTIDLSGLASNVRVGLGVTGLSTDVDVLNINSLFADGSNEIHLISSADFSQWVIDGTNRGTLNGLNTAFYFEGANHLRGVGENEFVFAENGALAVGDAGSGMVYGGAGQTQSLQAYGRENFWQIDRDGGGSLNQAAEPSLQFRNLKQLLGGDLADDFNLISEDAVIETIHGAAGTDQLRVSVQASGALDWQITDAGGNLNSAVDAISVNNFSDIEQLYGHEGVDRVSMSGAASLALLNTAGGNDEVSLYDSASVANLISGVGNDQVSIGLSSAGDSNASVGQIALGEGADTLSVAGEASVVGLMDGGPEPGPSSGDTLSFVNYQSDLVVRAASGEADDFQFSNFETLVGTSGYNNTLIADDIDNDWLIDGENSGQLAGLTFKGFDTLIGGGERDDFVLGSLTASITGSLLGGAGQNSLQANTGSNQWLIDGANEGVVVDTVARFEQIQSLVGGAQADHFVVAGAGSLALGLDGGQGSNSLELESGDNTWVLSGAYSGNVAGIPSFSAIQSLIGGTDSDNFIFQTDASVNAINGGEGQNRINLSALEQALAVRLGAGRVTNANDELFFTVEAIYEFNADNGLANVFYAGGGNNRWSVSGENAGTVEKNSTTVFNFSGFGRLVGGNAEDHFTLLAAASLSEGIDGGNTAAGLLDTLQAQNHVNQWVLSGPDTGSLSYLNTSLNFSRINRLVSGDQADTLTLTAANASLSGNYEAAAGTDRIIAAARNNDWRSLADGSGEIQSIIEFSGVERWFGNSGNDTFSLANLETLEYLDGDEGINALSFNALPGTEVHIETAEPSNLGPGLTVRRLTFISGDELSLFGPSVAAQWQLGNNYVLDYQDGSAAISTQLSGVSSIQGGNADDTFIVTTSLAGFDQSNPIDGGAGLNSLIVDSASNQWQLQGSNQGQVSVGGIQSVLAFDNMQNLTGGSGVDTLVLADNAGLTGLFDGAQGDDTIQGYASNTAWRITALNQGEVIEQGGSGVLTFSNIENLTGQDGIDEFQLAAGARVTGWIDGGLPLGSPGQNNNAELGDVLNLSAYGDEAFIINLDASEPGAEAINIIGVERTLLPDNHNGSLFAGNGDNEWLVTGENTYTVNGTEVRGYRNISGGDGDDIITFESDGFLSGDVDGGAGSNTLVGFDLDAIWQIDGNGSGTLWASNGDADSQRISGFESIQSIRGGSAADEYRFSADGRIQNIADGGGVDRIFLAETSDNVSESLENSNSVLAVLSEQVEETGSAEIMVVGRAMGIDHLHTGGGDDSVVLAPRTDLKTIDMGDGADLIDLRAQTRDLSLNLVSGESGYALLNSAENFALINRYEQVLADASHANQLRGLDQSGLWRLSDGHSGVVNYEALGLSLSFSGFSELLGGAGDDVFNLAELALPNGIAGGDGDNTLVSQITSGNAATWTLSGENLGDLEAVGETLNWSDIHNLQGSAADDYFNLGAFAVEGSIVGGAGNDSLQGNNSLQQWGLTVNEQTAVLEGVLEGQQRSTQRFSDIETLVGSGQDLLHGPSIDSQWQISDLGAGQLSSADFNIGFSGMGTLSAGAGDDEFLVDDTAYITGFVSAGEGNDQLIISQTRNTSVYAQAEYAELSSSDADAIVAVGFERLEASAQGQNVLYGPSLNNTGYRWLIQGLNRGQVSAVDADGNPLANSSPLDFQNFSQLVGGDRADEFSLAVAGRVNRIVGGGDRDFIDYSLLEQNIEVIVGGEIEVAGGFTISGIEGVRGNNDGTGEFDATLRASTDINEWILSDTEAGAANTGVFRALGSGSGIEFQDFNHLVGGAGPDRFVSDGSSVVTGSVSGGGGRDEFAVVSEQAIAPLTFSFENSVSSADFNIFSIEALTGNGNRLTLIAPNQTNRWRITGVDSGSISAGSDSNPLVLDFTGVQNVHGGSEVDQFNILGAGRLSGWLQGGAGEDSVNLAVTDNSVLVLSDRDASTEQSPYGAARAHVTSDVEYVSGSEQVASQLITWTDNDSEWLIDAVNAGMWRELRFERFATVTGGDGNDRFTVQANGALNGVLDGGAGRDRVIVGENVTLGDESFFEVALVANTSNAAVGANTGARLRISGVENLQGNASVATRLWGKNNSNNRWLIDDSNRGRVGQVDDTDTLANLLSFTDISDLMGGSGDDDFRIIDSGEISGVIDGRGDVLGDRYDLSEAIGAQRLVISSPDTGIVNIEHLVGNEESTLVGANEENTWRMDAANGGRLSYQDGTIGFSGFSRLEGGSASDTFYIEGSAFDGEILGGDGNDRMFVRLPTTLSVAESSLVFLGGEGQDRLNIDEAEGLQGVSGSYRARQNRPAEIAFDYGEQVLSVEFDGLELAEQHALTDRFVVQASVESDTFSLGPDTFSVNDQTAISYNADTTVLQIAGDLNDELRLSGSIDLANSLIVDQLAVVAELDTLLQVPNLTLNSVRSFVASDSVGVEDKAMLPVATDIRNLSLNNVVGPVAISNERGVTLGPVDTQGDLYINALGGIDQSQAARVRGVLDLVAEGAVLLDRNNTLFGPVNIQAAQSAVTLKNQVATQIGSVVADSLAVVSQGSLIAEGVVEVNGLVSLDTSNSEGSIAFVNPNNRIALLDLQSGGAGSITSGVAMEVQRWQSKASGDVEAPAISLAGILEAGGPFAANATEDLLSLSGQLFAGGDILLSGSGLLVASEANIDANSLMMDAQTGDLAVNTNLSVAGDVTIKGATVNLARALETGANIIIDASDRADANGALRAESVIEINAGDGGVYLNDPEGAAASTIEISTTGVLSTSTLNAERILLDVSGAASHSGDIVAGAGGIEASVGSWNSIDQAAINGGLGGVAVDAEGTARVGPVNSAGNLSLISQTANIIASGPMRVEGDASLVAANGISSATIEGENIQLSASAGDIELLQDLSAQQALVIDAQDGTITMSPQSASFAQIMEINAGESVLISQLIAQDSVQLNAQRVASNLSGSDSARANIEAQKLIATTRNGFGSSNLAVTTQLSEIDVKNAESGEVNIANSGELNVTALKNWGDITLINDVDVNYGNGSIDGIYRADGSFDPSAIEHPVSGARIELFSDAGSFRYVGNVDRQDPAMLGTSISVFSQQGDFAGPGAPPVIYARDSFRVFALRTWNRPIWAFGSNPEWEDGSRLKSNLNDIGAGEQLVEVESLEDIDPAIFSNLRAFSHSEMAIRLPRDQLYEEELEQLERGGR